MNIFFLTKEHTERIICRIYTPKGVVVVVEVELIKILTSIWVV
ncbi:MAG: hypothetical protein ACI9FW_002357 [Flavobacterium sp.]|jgi:hypothetical protein